MREWHTKLGCEEQGKAKKLGKAYIMQHILEARRQWSPAVGTICAVVLCLLLLQMQQHLVVREECGLGVFDLLKLLVNTNSHIAASLHDREFAPTNTIT